MLGKKYISLDPSLINTSAKKALANVDAIRKMANQV